MQEKILAYLEKSITKRPIEYMAKDITEIVKAELSDTIYADLMKSEYELQKENAELKSKLSNIKYLSKGKVTKIIEDLLNSRTDINYGICDSITGNPMKDYVMQLQKIAEKAIDKILSLAIPNKDKIISAIMDLPIIKKQIEQWYKDTSPCCASMEVDKFRNQLDEIINK